MAVDGITAAGKTSPARELTAALVRRGRAAAQLSMDGCHHPRAQRHRQGAEPATGYYEDAYDFAAFARLVLEPLAAADDARYVPSILDLASDLPTSATPVALAADAVLVVDGSFLQRDLRPLWDEVIWLEASFEVAALRGAGRLARPPEEERLRFARQVQRAFEHALQNIMKL